MPPTLLQNVRGGGSEDFIAAACQAMRSLACSGALMRGPESMPAQTNSS